MEEKRMVWDVAEELRKVLRANEKRFMTLTAVKEKLSSQLRRYLGMTGRRLTAPSLKKILEPHLDEALEIRTNGRYTYLVAVGDPGDLIADFIEKNPGRLAGGLAASLPFRKAEFLNLLNGLMKEGRPEGGARGSGAMRVTGEVGCRAEAGPWCTAGSHPGGAG